MAESKYLSLDDFKKTDEKSQEKIMEELNSDNESKQYLYWMKYAMDDNDRHRAKMTSSAFYGKNGLSEETRKNNLESKKDELENEINVLKMESYDDKKSIDLDDVLKEKDDEELESIDEEDSEDNNLEEEQEEAKAIKLCKLMNELEAIEKQLENNDRNDGDGDKEFSNSMSNFNTAAKRGDITKSKGLDAIENNLKTAIELLYDSTAKRQIKLLVKPAAIQKLLATFQNLRKTQLDNVLKTIPSDLPTERKKALVTIYKNDFWNAYEQEVRDFLSKETNMLKSKDKIEVKLKNKGTKIKEKFVNKKDKIVNTVKRKLDFGLKGKENYENVLDNFDNDMNFKKETSKDYSTPQGKGNSVQQKIIDLVASTLRPTDSKNDSRLEENTYGGYYSEIQKIMDKYMKDDDYYDRYNSKGMRPIEGLFPYDDDNKKSLNQCTLKFTYSLLAILMVYDGKDDANTRRILQYGLGDSMVDKHLIYHDMFPKGNIDSDFEQKFGSAYTKLRLYCQDLSGDKELSKNKVDDLLKEFTDIGISEREKLFHDLCSNKKIDIQKNPYNTYFEKLQKKLRQNRTK